MPLSPDEMATVRAHVEKHLVNPRCPICGNVQWQFGGPVAQPSYEEKPNMDPAAVIGESGIFPIVFMLCTTCFYVHQFAWLSVREAAKKDG